MATTIATVQEFLAINNDLEGDYELVNDLDFSGQSFSGGKVLGVFKGSLNGNGKTLLNITITGWKVQSNTDAGKTVGSSSLFEGLMTSSVSNLRVKNLTLDMRDCDRQLLHAASLGYYNLAAVQCFHVENMHVRLASVASEQVVVSGISSVGLSTSANMCSIDGVHVTEEGPQNENVAVRAFSINMSGTVTNSYMRDVTGADRVTIDNGENRVSNCYIATENGKIRSSAWPQFTRCYYDATRGVQDTYNTPFAKTTAEMKQQATFEDWDFEDVWTIREGQDYPELRCRVGVFGPLTAAEYDALDLQAQEYDAEGLSAQQYDNWGKWYLVESKLP
ncbi:hypothetical protein LJC49_08095 [Ruminococcaceae bacterium OttesenSCG-928-I18]|nr:hypothetical protein [Ruminococcaceae bacterium OttesenSCG-928-I18]